jgi:hypothetical protein
MVRCEICPLGSMKIDEPTAMRRLRQRENRMRSNRRMDQLCLTQLAPFTLLRLVLIAWQNSIDRCRSFFALDKSRTFDSPARLLGRDSCGAPHRSFRCDRAINWSAVMCRPYVYVRDGANIGRPPWLPGTRRNSIKN